MEAVEFNTTQRSKAKNELRRHHQDRWNQRTNYKSFSRKAKPYSYSPYGASNIYIKHKCKPEKYISDYDEIDKHSLSDSFVARQYRVEKDVSSREAALETIATVPHRNTRTSDRSSRVQHLKSRLRFIRHKKNEESTLAVPSDIALVADAQEMPDEGQFDDEDIDILAPGSIYRGSLIYEPKAARRQNTANSDVMERIPSAPAAEAKLRDMGKKIQTIKAKNDVSSGGKQAEALKRLRTKLRMATHRLGSNSNNMRVNTTGSTRH